MKKGVKTLRSINSKVILDFEKSSQESEDELESQISEWESR